MKLVIADSGMTKSGEIYNEIKQVNRGDIILKEVVNPQEELSKAWVYVYPLRTERETFSVPLSLIEAIQIKVPYICTDVGGLKEYFDEKHLVKPGDVNALADKIEKFIKNPEVAPLKEKIDKMTVEEYMGLY